MITAPDFQKKQVVFAFASEGERLSLQNDNLILKDGEGNIKLQCTCYRLFLVYVVGHCSLTTALIQAAKKYGFFFALMSTGFRLIEIIGGEKEGNTLLKKKQYSYTGLGIAKHIVQNKIQNSIRLLKDLRGKTEFEKEAIAIASRCADQTKYCNTLSELMAYEGQASKVYLSRYFACCGWKGRQPRLKRDIINSTLDVGYTLLFNFIDSILQCYGFDTYCGVMHTQFYMRKSLVCDIEEPFRVIVDRAVRKAYNLGQIKPDDFFLQNNQYKLKWEQSKKYVQIIMKPIIEEKDAIFLYVQKYYRAFMKESPAADYPIYEVDNGISKL